MRKRKTLTLSELKAKQAEIMKAIKEKEDQEKMMIGEKAQTWVQAHPCFEEKETLEIMEGIYRVYENVHWIFNDKLSHSSTTIRSINWSGEGQCDVRLSNGVAFEISYSNGQDFLEQLATKWNSLVKEGKA